MTVRIKNNISTITMTEHSNSTYQMMANFLAALKSRNLIVDGGETEAYAQAFLLASGATKESSAGKLQGKKGKKKGDMKEGDSRRVKNAYMRYLEANRETIQKELGGAVKIGPLAQEAGRRWKQMSDEEKKPYQDAYLEAKQAFISAKTDTASTREGGSDISMAPTVIFHA